MEEKTTKKKVENLPPNYRTLAQLQEQWEKKRAQELNRNQLQEKEEEEPAPETVFLGDGGGGDTCPEVKATGEEGGVETKKNRSKKSKKKKGKGKKNEGEVKPREVKKEEKEKSDVESEGEGNPRGERKGGGSKGLNGNRAVEKWVKVGSVGVGESDRTVGKELEIENVVVESDRKVMAGRVGEPSVKRGRGRGRGPRVMGKRRDGAAKAEGLEVENVGVDENDQCLGSVKENVGVDESNFAVEVGRELGELSVGDVRKNSQRGYTSGGNRAKWKNGRVRRGGGVATHRDKTVKVEGFETENVGIEENDQTLDAEIVGVEESDQTAGIGRKLSELSVRVDGESSGHRGRNGGRYGTKGQNIRGGRGKGGMGHHGDRMLKGLEIENVEAERSNQKVENVVEVKGAVGKNVRVAESHHKAEVRLPVRNDEGREDARTYRHRDHNGGGNITKWKKGSQGRGRGEMSYHRDQMVVVEKELDMENLGVEESDQTVENVVEIRDVVEENLGVECDQTLDDVLEIKDAVEENVEVESGGTAEVVNWQYERAGRRGGGRTNYRRVRGRGGYSNGNDKWGNERGNQRRGRERNGTVWVRKEAGATRSKDMVAGEGVKRSVGILS